MNVDADVVGEGRWGRTTGVVAVGVARTERGTELASGKLSVDLCEGLREGIEWGIE